MAIKKIEDIREDATFGRKLFLLGEKNNLLGPAQIAEALFENIECRKILFKKTYYPKGGKASIARSVQAHMEKEKAYEIDGKYLLAYSILFDCSMDYLYGLIDEEYPNMEVRDICKKTGLSSQSVKHLIEKKEVFLGEDFIDGLFGSISFPNVLSLDDVNDYDNEDDIFAFSTKSIFWDDVLSGEAFDTIADDWFRLLAAYFILSLYNDELKYVDKKQEEFKNPSFESFEEMVDLRKKLDPSRTISCPYDCSNEEAFKKDSEWANTVFRELYYDLWEILQEKRKEKEMIYWGCSGKFEKYIIGFFHERIEKWYQEKINQTM